MIFAELQYKAHYSEVHDDLLSLLESNFRQVESGHQGDSWIWVRDGDSKVEIDTFYSMTHQIKCREHSQLVDQVVKLLSHHYPMQIMHPPAAEPHE